MPQENAQKVSKRIRRIRGNYLSASGECAESIYAYSEKVFKRIWRTWQIGVICGTQNRLQLRGKYLNVFGECGERIFVIWRRRKDTLGVRYSPYAAKDIKVCIY